MSRALILRVLDALELGDQREAVSLLLAALEDGEPTRSLACPSCAARFSWPGELDHHERFAHFGGGWREL